VGDTVDGQCSFLFINIPSSDTIGWIFAWS